MKVFIHYEDNDNEELHKTSKITLPVKWVDGPISAVLELFVKTYNGKFETNQLSSTETHLENDKGEAFANECIVSEYLSASSDIYVKHGVAPALSAVTAAPLKPKAPKPAASSVTTKPKPSADGLILCRRFGCQKKFDPKLNTPTACCFHRLPPVFHETVKFWACCPDKKAYSWDSFMEIQGCQSGEHTHEKPDQPSVLGGCDVRSGNDGSEETQEKLKSIADFNEERRQQGGSNAGDAIAKMYQLRQAFDKSGMSGALFDAAKEKVLEKNNGDHMATLSVMSDRLTACLNAMAE